jgi:photosystem II stability/assembly factor-like uncharacterized protein
MRRRARIAGRLDISIAIVCVGILCLVPAVGADEVAIPSDRASKTLLLDAAYAGDRIVAVGDFGHVVLSDDAGASWRQANSVPTRTTLTGVYFPDDQHGWAVGHDAVVIHTRDAGESWVLQHRDAASDGPLFSIWLDASGRGIAVGAYGLALETDDGGGHWRPIHVGAPDDDYHLNELFEARDGTLFVAAEAGNVYRSQDGGRTWVRRTASYLGSFWGGLALTSGRLLVFGMRGHIFLSDDGGEVWRPLPKISDHSLGGGAELESGEVLVAGLAGSVLISRDGGQSYQAMTRPERRGANAVLALPGGHAVLLFGEGGVQHFSPQGAHATK